jgi:hypothetical protein
LPPCRILSSVGPSVAGSVDRRIETPPRTIWYGTPPGTIWYGAPASFSWLMFRYRCAQAQRQPAVTQEYSV